jgi:hypothetical protein
MSTKGKQAAAAAPIDGAGLAINNEDLRALGELGVEDDGLHEADQSDVRIATKTLNMKGTDRDGNEVPKSAFYDTVEETFKKQLRMVAISLHKSNVYSRYNNAEGKTKIICRSDDLKMGTMRETREERPCKGCPDAKWYEGVDEEGKKRNLRNCHEVHTVISYDLDEEKLFSLRFKKGARKIWTDHLNRHHLNKGKPAGFPTQHVPLYAFELKATGVLAEGGAHAVPVLERGRILSKPEFLQMAEGAKFARERAAEMTASADEQGEASEAPEGGDTSFNPEGFTQSAGKDFAA